MNKRYFIKVSHVESADHYYINFYGKDACVLARDYRCFDRHEKTTMRSDYIMRHGYKTQNGAENSYFFKKYINDEYWKAEIICYYC